MRDAPKGKQRVKIWQCRDAGNQKSPASTDLVRCRLVLRRHAAYCIGDHAVDKLQIFRRGRVVAAAREPIFEQRAVQELAGIVAEKGPSGAVGAFQTGRQAHDEQPCRVGAERWDRAIEPIGMGAPVLCAELDQAWAKRTIAVRLGFLREARGGQRHERSSRRNT